MPQYATSLRHFRRHHAPVAVAGVRDEALASVEAALFAAAGPLTARRLAEVCGLGTARAAREQIERLRRAYEADDTAFTVAEIAGGYQLLTRPEHDAVIRKLVPKEDLKLSPAAQETLAIVAYKQPLTRADLEAIRGVQCGEMLRQLLDLGLVRVAGRHESLGRPLLYGTTKTFLARLGLASLEQLPRVG